MDSPSSTSGSPGFGVTVKPTPLLQGTFTATPTTGPYTSGETVTVRWADFEGGFDGLYIYAQSSDFSTSYPIVQKSECATTDFNTCRFDAVPTSAQGGLGINSGSDPTSTSVHGAVNTKGVKRQAEPNYRAGDLTFILNQTKVLEGYFGIVQTAIGEESATSTYTGNSIFYSPTVQASSDSPTTAASTSVKQTAAPSGVSQATTAPAASTSSNSHGGLSPGAIAGIVVGIIVAALFIAGLIFVLLRRKRRSRPSHSPLTPAGDMSYTHDPSHRSADNIRAEKDLNIINSSSARTDSYELVDGNGHPNSAGAVAPRSFEQYRDVEDHEHSVAASSHASPHPAAAAVVVPSRKPVAGSSNSPTAGHSAARTEGMTAEERARWDEEEARLDEAIAEAERRGNR